MEQLKRYHKAVGHRVRVRVEFGKRVLGVTVKEEIDAEYSTLDERVFLPDRIWERAKHDGGMMGVTILDERFKGVNVTRFGGLPE